MPRSKEWLLLNAVECWLHYVDKASPLVDEYVELRDALRISVDAEEELLKDADNDAPSPTRTTRKRSTTSK